MYVATLIARDGKGVGDETVAHVVLAEVGCIGPDPDGWRSRWIDEGFALDIPFDDYPDRARDALEGDLVGPLDVVIQSMANREKRLLVADMDSTMITVECIDELADYAGIKAEVAAVTEAAMRGELDFVAALDARVALLKGLPASTIDRCHAERVHLMPGARALVQTMHANGAYTVLVSGGFTLFADRVAAAIGFDRAIANTLLIEDEALTGKVARPVVDSATKLATLKQEAEARGLSLADCLAVGDGANDIPMIEAAGLGIAYHAKPRTRDAAGAAVRFGDLSVLLYAQGYPRATWTA